MFPSKPVVDYMDEIFRLFPRTTENDLLSSPPTYSTSFLSSPISSGAVNRSSSSADSTSPESFPHISNYQSPDLTIAHQSTSPDTPFIPRYRPIVGRKYPNTKQPAYHDVVDTPAYPNTWDRDQELAIWQNDEFTFSQTPPNNPMFHELRNVTPNTYYELFPPEKKFENKTPVKSRHPVSSCNTSPNFSQMSEMSPRRSPIIPSPIRSNAIAISPMYSVARSSNSPSGDTKVCTFCRKNGETPVVYMTHTVKEKIGNTFIVTCPILRSHVCSTCGGTGDNAHTITYCPVLRNRNNGQPLQSTTITLKNTRIKSNGRKRY
ncbi:uncharacterized protein LOC131855498 [Achroia grisella]|uniref:uncharacterized protein LOC131855498 n=1 Tax=Achroia grisella TaxID=688607 RepID=UPI0027D28CF5|nr:uncharacterized protein LOC131855498 [Achroia grisella]